MKNLIIYSITNTVNGKRYVGQSRQGLARRKGEHIHRFNLGDRDHKLYQAMRKHGVENFKFEILCHALKAEYLDDLEQLFIERFNCFHRGYNMTCGGDSASDETRAKLSAALKGREITWGDKISKAHRDGKYPTNFFKGMNGAKHPCSKSYLVRLPDGEEVVVKGLHAFCKERGLDTGTMHHTFTGKQRHHKGYSLLARFND